jgi:hypothetical protein
MEVGVSDADPRDVIRPTMTGATEAPVRRLCRHCGAMLDQSLISAGADTHPGCVSFTANQPAPEAGTEHPRRTELIELIRFADRNSVRSRQLAVGPSELGNPCDRRLAMRLAAVRPVNRTSDPWPAIVGTAMHDWLQRCLERDNAARVAAGLKPRWITEAEVNPDPLIRGRSDVYDRETYTVIDWKSMGDTARRKLAQEGPSWGYYVQDNTYGLGFHRAGFRVDRVALMFLPRAGKLSDARYYEWPFDPAVAQQAIERMYRIGRQVLLLQQQYGVPDVWEQVAPDATQLCGWCPFYSKSAIAASDKGCPGKKAS